MDPLSECFAPAELGLNLGEIRPYPLVAPVVDAREVAEGVLVDRRIALLPGHQPRARQMLDSVAVRAQGDQSDDPLAGRPARFVVLVVLVDLDRVPLPDATTDLAAVAGGLADS